MPHLFNVLRAQMRSSMLAAIVGLNVAVFIVLRLAALVLHIAGVPAAEHVACLWVELPSAPALLLVRPWTVLTYMVSQYDLFHLLFNMLWLWWFGKMFLDISTERQLTALYIYGGLGGAVLFLLIYNVVAVGAGGGLLIGSSAAVLAIVTATAILMPDYEIGLMFIGPVKLKWVAIATVVLALLGLTGMNAGGEIAHLGGIATGAFYAVMRKRGSDITRPLNQMLDSIVNLFKTLHPRRSTGRHYSSREAAPGHRPPQADKDMSREQARRELDEILDKIKKSGYGGLTDEERRRLFDVSSRIK